MARIIISGGTMQVIEGGKSEGGSHHGTPLSQAQDRASTFVMLEAGGERFALPVETTREITRVPAITWIPGSREPVCGVINLRGSVVPVIDLAGALNLQSRKQGDDERIIIVDHDDEMVGLKVDKVLEVARIDPEAITPSMRTLTENGKEMINGQTTIEGVITGVLDTGKVIGSVRIPEDGMRGRTTEKNNHRKG
jgi:purine-binding chemotaxis protein CheW